MLPFAQWNLELRSVQERLFPELSFLPPGGRLRMLLPAGTTSVLVSQSVGVPSPLTLAQAGVYPVGFESDRVNLAASSIDESILLKSGSIHSLPELVPTAGRNRLSGSHLYFLDLVNWPDLGGTFRARRMSLTATVNDSEFCLVDMSDSLNEFAGLLRRRFRWPDLRVSEQLDALTDVVASAFVNPADVVGPLPGALQGEDLGELKGALDQWIMPLGFELTRHGIERTFRFFTDQNIADVLTTASKLCAGLAASGLPAVCSGGTALGLHRERRLLPHDDDIDIFVVIDDAIGLGPAVEAVCREAGALEMTVVREPERYVRTAPSFGEWMEVSFSDHRFPCQIDVFVLVTQSDGCIVAPLIVGEDLRVEDLLPVTSSSVQAFGPLPMPADPETYLRKTYGVSWQTPTMSWDPLAAGETAASRDERH